HMHPARRRRLPVTSIGLAALGALALPSLAIAADDPSAPAPHDADEVASDESTSDPGPTATSGAENEAENNGENDGEGAGSEAPDSTDEHDPEQPDPGSGHQASSDEPDHGGTDQTAPDDSSSDPSADEPSPDEQRPVTPESDTEETVRASDPTTAATTPQATDGGGGDPSTSRAAPNDTTSGTTSGSTSGTTSVTTTSVTTTDAAAPDAATPGVDAPASVPTSSGIDLASLPARTQHVLATIRYMESRNQYGIPPNTGNASGAYQFIESTWARHGGYQHAYLAPPAVQDERAAIDVQRFLDQFDGDVSMVPVMWSYPIASRQLELMDVVPKPQHGNKLTIREYQTRWLEVYSEISGERFIAPPTASEFERRSGSAPVVPSITTRRVVTDDDGGVDDEVALAAAALDDGPGVALSYPVLGPSRLASLDCAEDQDGGEATLADEVATLCADVAPGVVFGVKLQPVLAAADGIVTEIDDVPGSGRPISLTITSPDGISIEYRGFNDDSPGTDDGAAPAHLRLSPLAELGGIVRAGQVIGFMGDSDPLPPDIRADVPTDATESLDPSEAAPHVRLTITDSAGRPLDAVGPLLDARARESCRVGIGGWSMPPLDEVVDEVTIETTDLHDDIDSQWVITPTGQVVASGWAAMINPVELCGWVPADAFGPGANGSVDWLDHWLLPYELPTTLWVDLALRADDTADSFVLPG
ncbi:MAG: hypothetical protein AAGG08_06260, partial [Actinomycetota bacterium]